MRRAWLQAGEWGRAAADSARARALGHDATDLAGPPAARKHRENQSRNPGSFARGSANTSMPRSGLHASMSSKYDARTFAGMPMR